MCHDCIDKLWGGRGESEVSKQVGDSTMAEVVQSEEDKEEEVEGAVCEKGGGGDEARKISVVSLHGLVGVLSIGYFLSVGSSSKPPHSSFPSSL